MVTLDYKTNIEHDIRKARNEKMDNYRQYAFYVPELDAIIIQCFYDNCRVVFHWDWFDCAKAYENLKDSGVDDPLDIFFLMPLGEV